MASIASVPLLLNKLWGDISIARVDSGSSYPLCMTFHHVDLGLLGAPQPSGTPTLLGILKVEQYTLISPPGR